MAKTIAVTGATGTQGGAVARALLEAGWKVRGITRKTDSDAAKKLASQGAEVVSASFDDQASLEKAFEGAHAIFAVTNFWEHLMMGKSQDEAGEIEEKQGNALAKAAAKSSTLEHYIWSTLPSATKTSNGKCPVPHFDYKANVDELIRRELPELAKKTTYLFFGWYPSNMVFLPLSQPIEWPGAYGAHIWIQPASSSSGIISAGDLSVTPGIWAKAILEQPSKSLGKYVTLATETLTWAEILDIWSKVTGKRASFLSTSMDDFVSVWGPFGKEYAQQLVWGESIGMSDFGAMAAGPSVSNEELGISVEGVGTKAALEKFKAAGLLGAASG